MARKNKKNKDIQKAEMPKVPEKRPFDEDTLDFVQLEVYRKEKGELHEQDPRKPINAEGGGGPERLDLLKRLSVFRGKGDTPVKKAAEGGSMTKQMEMFEDGGLKDEGGMTDEVSGNDVPIGSTREEVRDDIPAQLSEGEFVFPADVVRFMGLEKLMMLRQKAKEGLKKMEDMGQMGNSEEATLPDDMPFDMDDLDMEDDKEEEVADSNFNRGGVVTMAEGGTTPTTENTDLKFNQGGTTRSNYGDFYKFKMPGSSKPNNFLNPYTKDGKQYFGFRPLTDGRVAAYRKRDDVDPDTGESPGNAMDILDADTKFSVTNPDNDIDPPTSKALTVSEMANMKDGKFSSRYMPITNEVYYKSLKGYLSPKTPPKQVAEPMKTKQVAEPNKPIFDIPFPSFSKVNQIESKNTKTSQTNNISTSKPPVNQLTKTKDIEPNRNAFLEFKTPQRTTVQQKPLNVRQAQVPTRNVSNLPNTKTFLSKQTTPTVNLEATQPIDTSSRYTNIYKGLQDKQNKQKEKQKTIKETNEELQSLLSINPYESNKSYESNEGGESDFSNPPNKDGGAGINYADTQRFDLPDRARDALNSFSMSQLSMFSVLNPTNSAFSVFASAAGAGLADITKGKSADIIGGPVMTAEKGKARAIAFNTAMIDIQRDFGIKVGTPMQDWPLKAQNQIGIRGEYALKTGAAIHNARYNLPFESNLTEKEISFMEKAKQKFSNLSNYLKDDTNTEKPDYTNPINSVDGVGIGKSTGAGSTTIGTEDVDPTKGASYGFIGPSAYNNDRAYYDVIGELLAAELSNEKIANTEMGITQGGFEDSSMVGDLTELGFSNNSRDVISAAGGSIGIGYNSSGTPYSKNKDGSFTYIGGSTSNVVDKNGNPINAPSTSTPREEVTKYAKDLGSGGYNAGGEEMNPKGGIQASLTTGYWGMPSLAIEQAKQGNIKAQAYLDEVAKANNKPSKSYNPAPPVETPSLPTFSPPAKTATPTPVYTPPVYTPPAYIPPTEDNNDNNGGNDGTDGGYGGPDNTTDYGGT